MSNALIDTKIVQSPHYSVYSHWLRNGMSNRKCERKAKELFNEDISYEAFRRYKNSMSPDEIIPDILPFGQYDLDFDEEKHLMQAILLVEQRIIKAQELEKKLNGILLDKVDKTLIQLTNMLVKLAQIKGKGLSQVNVKTQINQQFNRNGTSQTEYVSESDAEFTQRIVDILEQNHSTTS